jgi:hypothetical protein
VDTSVTTAATAPTGQPELTDLVEVTFRGYLVRDEGGSFDLLMSAGDGADGVVVASMVPFAASRVRVIEPGFRVGDEAVDRTTGRVYRRVLDEHGPGWREVGGRRTIPDDEITPDRLVKQEVSHRG